MIYLRNVSPSLSLSLSQYIYMHTNAITVLSVAPWTIEVSNPSVSVRHIVCIFEA